MKKSILMLSLILAPIFLMAQSTINLKEQGLAATMQNPQSYEYTIDKDSDPMTLAIYNINIDGDNIKINVLDKKKITAKKLIGMMNSAIKSANTKNIKVKVIKKDANMMMIERTTVSTGEKIYKFLYTTSQKGKDFMIESNDMNDLDKCYVYLNMAKSFKMD